MTRFVAAALVAAVTAALAGCGEAKPAAAPTSPNPPASELFDKKAPPRKAKGKADPG